MAKRNRIDRKQLQILIDTSEGVDQLGYLQEQYKRLAQEAKTTESAMTARAVERQMTVLRDRIQDVREELGLQGMTVNQLRQYYRELDRESKTSTGAIQKKAKLEKEAVLNQIDSMNEGMSRRERQEKALNDELQRSLKANKLTGLSLDQLKLHHRNLTEQIEKSTNFESAANRKRIAQAREVDQLITSRRNTITGAGGLFGQIKAAFPSALAGAVGGLTVGMFDQMLSQIKRLADDGLEYIQKKARSVSEIQNILLVDEKKANEVYERLSKINTETSRDQLKELVLVAGDLNVATDDVQAFVEAADKLEIVFKRDFEGVGNASTEIAKLKDTFAETKELEIQEAFARIGSALKVLNDEGPATTKGMTEFLARIGQLPDAFKPAIQDTAALAAVFEEANISAQISSGGITNVLLTASKYGGEFGEMFGMAKDEFLSWMSSDPIGFLTTFAKGLKDMDESQIGEVFKSLHIESQESVKTLGTLSNNLDKFYQKQSVAAKAFKDASRIDEIFTVFNNDDRGEVERAKKKIGLFFRGIRESFGRTMEGILIDMAGGYEAINQKTDEQIRLLQEKAQRYVVSSGRAPVILNGQSAFNNYGAGTDLNKGLSEFGVKPEFKPTGSGESEADRKLKREQEKLEQLAKARVENEARTLQDIYRMNIQAIEDELLQKELLIRNDLEKEAESRRKLIEEGKYDVEDFNTWHAAASRDVERQITDIKTEAADKSAKEKQAIEEKVRRMTLETALQLAEDSKDQEAILSAEYALRKHQFEVDYAKATAAEKTAIYNKYLADLSRMDANYQAGKEQAETKYQDFWKGVIKAVKEQKKKEEDEELERKRTKSENQLQIASSVADGIAGIYRNSLDKQENDLRVSLQAQFDQLTEQKAKGFLSEEAYQLAKLNLEKKSDREIAEIKRKQAIADKAAALIQIAINTAIAASKAASQTGVGAALAVPLVIAGGAAQAAVVASQPIPSFYAGGNTGPAFGNADPLGGKMAIVHPNEEIIPAAVTQTPAFAAIKPMIDSISPSSAPASGGDQTPGNTVNVEFGDLPATLADLKKTNEMLMKRLENLTVGMRGSDWRRFHEDYTDYLKQNENALINE
ncbi:phage tail tape measure protein [Jiulongibacter sediminis]|uniref:phage tail tape measure protein n=1 Tax=Jiulongibacter sediminis TaxID=1605367 RepID=UPI0026ECCBE0|nr:phage tail tape measure protein [Jiulongibacter sediminis]